MVIVLRGEGRGGLLSWVVIELGITFVNGKKFIFLHSVGFLRDLELVELGAEVEGFSWYSSMDKVNEDEILQKKKIW